MDWTTALDNDLNMARGRGSILCKRKICKIPRQCSNTRRRPSTAKDRQSPCRHYRHPLRYDHKRKRHDLRSKRHPLLNRQTKPIPHRRKQRCPEAKSLNRKRHNAPLNDISALQLEISERTPNTLPFDWSQELTEIASVNFLRRRKNERVGTIGS